jgi:hypothetical protein
MEEKNEKKDKKIKRVKKGDSPLFCSPLEKRDCPLFLIAEIGEHGGEVAGDQQNAHDNQKDPAHSCDDSEILPDGLKIFKKFVDEDPRQEERKPQS